MHELSIATRLFDAVEARAGGCRVTSVELVIGKLTGIDVEAVRFCFGVVARGSRLDGARVEVEEIGGRGRCALCGRDVELESPLLRCASCGDAELTIVAGEELMVRSMEVEDV